MALEQIGEAIQIEELRKKLKKRFPDYDFDTPPPPDTRHKAPGLCKSNELFYLDTEGNKYCGQRFKLQDLDDPYRWNWATCNALVKSKEENYNARELPF